MCVGKWQLLNVFHFPVILNSRLKTPWIVTSHFLICTHILRLCPLPANYEVDQTEIQRPQEDRILVLLGHRYNTTKQQIHEDRKLYDIVSFPCVFAIYKTISLAISDFCGYDNQISCTPQICLFLYCFLVFLLECSLSHPHHPCFGSTVENVKEVLQLSVEQKGVKVPTGELTVYLDGLTISDQEELAPITNGSTANGNSEYYTC